MCFTPTVCNTPWAASLTTCTVELSSTAHTISSTDCFEGMPCLPNQTTHCWRYKDIALHSSHLVPLNISHTSNIAGTLSNTQFNTTCLWGYLPPSFPYSVRNYWETLAHMTLFKASLSLGTQEKEKKVPPLKIFKLTCYLYNICLYTKKIKQYLPLRTFLKNKKQ